ncbi:MAG: A/G-specific adenine glycosylase [Lachnospiraceae bacterium]
MKYKRVVEGKFLERPNRFIAYIEIEGQTETVHVKNTGRCKELLVPGARVYVQEAVNPERKTKWDLIGVKKEVRMINMDSQVPNQVVKEWLEEGHLFEHITKIKPETTYGNSRFDLYIEADGRKIFMEVKGVTLERGGVALFPDAPSERAVKHVTELAKAVKEGYEAYVFLVIQMKGVRYFTPNMEMHRAFGEALEEAQVQGVHVLAYDCNVTKDSISIRKEVPVILGNPILAEMAEPLVAWYREHKRNLPWREHISAYRVWISEIMLQQTRVEAVKPYYKRFLEELPTVKELAEAKEDKLLKLWEGLGYYNRVRNMQKAAIQVMEEYGGEFPHTYEEIRSLTGIGNYTAGAIGSFAYGIPKPAVDGNVLRVISRLLAREEDIMKQSVRTKMEQELEQIIPEGSASDFNQGLIELGAIVCVPNGVAKCDECPLSHLCLAKAENRVAELPIKSKAKSRKIEEKTIFIFKDGENIALKKRAKKGLLAGMYEFPNVPGHLTKKEAIVYSKSIGLSPLRIKELPPAKHIFSHIEWQMIGYEVRVDELEKASEKDMLFIHPEDIAKEYPVPAAFYPFMPLKVTPASNFDCNIR